MMITITLDVPDPAEPRAPQPALPGGHTGHGPTVRGRAGTEAGGRSID